MNTKPKSGLKLPLFMLIAPAAAVILSIFLFGIVNFISGAMTPSTTVPTDSLSLADGTGTSVAQLAPTNSVFHMVTNVVLFILGVAGIVSFVPCLIIGILLLVKRSSTQPIVPTK